MAELVGEERVATDRAGARRGADQDLAHRGLIDPERRERIAGDAFVVLDLERVCRWGERTDDRGDGGDHDDGRETHLGRRDENIDYPLEPGKSLRTHRTAFCQC